MCYTYSYWYNIITLKGKLRIQHVDSWLIQMSHPLVNICALQWAQGSQLFK